MRFLLVTALNFNRSSGRLAAMPYIPLGLLAVGAVLEQEGHQVEIIDLNLLVQRGALPLNPQFYKEAVTLLGERQPDVIGFQTHGLAYHHTLALSQMFHQQYPFVCIILGGPHASEADLETLRLFPEVDVIVRGEADDTIRELAFRLEKGIPLSGLLGVSLREKGEATRNPPRPLITDLDVLPMPAYHLYPIATTATDEISVIPVDEGRGCPFNCSYCSTCAFWGRRWRKKSIPRLMTELTTLYHQYGSSRVFNFASDLFVLDRQHIMSFCKAMCDSGLSIRWACDCRVDHIEQDQLQAMREAGCIKIYYGIESGSPVVQQKMGKHLNLSIAKERVRHTRQLGINVVVSHIIGFPYETEDDVEATLRLIADFARERADTIQLHVLMPELATKLLIEYEDDLDFDGFEPDLIVAHRLPMVTDAQRHSIKTHRRMFLPFHYYRTPKISRTLTKGLSSLVYCVTNALPLTFAAMVDLRGRALDLCQDWVALMSPATPEELTPSEQFETFLSLVSQYEHSYAAGKVLHDLACYESTLYQLANLRPNSIGEDSSSLFQVPVSPHSVAHLILQRQPTVRLLHLAHRLKDIIAQVQAGHLADIPPQPEDIVIMIAPDQQIAALHSLTTMRLGRLVNEMLRLVDGCTPLGSLFKREHGESCPDQASLAKAATTLLKRGIVHVVR